MPKFGERSFVEDLARGEDDVRVEREMTRRALESASDELVDLSKQDPWERQRQEVAEPDELQDQGLLTQEQSDAVQEVLFPEVSGRLQVVRAMMSARQQSRPQRKGRNGVYSTYVPTPAHVFLRNQNLRFREAMGEAAEVIKDA